MAKYVVTYTLPYEHVVRVGIEADTAQAAQTIAESAFNDGVLWDNTPTMPLLMDEFEETGDAGVPVLFQATPVTEWPGNPPFFNGREKWSQATRANFCIGVMPLRSMFGRSGL